MTCSDKTSCTARVLLEQPSCGCSCQDTYTYSTAQPPPRRTCGPSMHDLVVEDLMRRKALGLERYRVPLQAFNGRDAALDLREELLDAVVYSRQISEELVRLNIVLDCARALVSSPIDGAPECLLPRLAALRDAVAGCTPDRPREPQTPDPGGLY